MLPYEEIPTPCKTKVIKTGADLLDFLNAECRMIGGVWKLKSSDTVCITTDSPFHTNIEIKLLSEHWMTISTTTNVNITGTGETKKESFPLPTTGAALQNTFGRMMGYTETNWENLKMQAWDEERKMWCNVTEINTYSNTTLAGLSTGYVSFWRDLSKTKLRYLPN